LSLATVALGAGAVAYNFAPSFVPKKEEAPVEEKQEDKVEIVFEKPRKRATASKEENRELLSPQHVQVKKSWEHPGVYAWGCNSGKVVAPDSDEAVIKTPRRIAYFDDQILRDLKLDRSFGAAVTENGDLVQWGAAFDKTETTPTVTLKGKDLVKIAISRDRIVGLASNGSVYSVPVSKADQTSVTIKQADAKDSKSSGMLWSNSPSSSSSINYRSIGPSKLSWNEKVVDIKSGLEHCLMLTSKGRVFSAVSSTEDFPERGQLGIPGLTWKNRPEGPYDQPHEITALSNVKEIAAGDYHSVALDSDGRVFSFGDNSNGQLGFEFDLSRPYFDAPTPLSFAKLYKGSGLFPKVTSIAAGGLNSFFTVDAIQNKGKEGGLLRARDVGRITADTWACGEGIHGSLGTGKWTHVSTGPSKIRALSGMFEFDDKAGKVVPIRLSRLSVGGSHAVAVLAHKTQLDASESGSGGDDTNFGDDVMVWGGNEHYQLGTGKRNNLNVPTHIRALDSHHKKGKNVSADDEVRFQITPRKTVRLGEGGKGRKVSVEQRAECGREVTAVYSGA